MLNKLTEMVSTLSLSTVMLQQRMEDAQTEARREKMMREVHAPMAESPWLSVDGILRKLDAVESLVRKDETPEGHADFNNSNCGTAPAGSLMKVNIGTSESASPGGVQVTALSW